MLNIKMSQLELSYIIPIYQDNIENNDIEELIKIYSSYAPSVLKQIQFIFVDDGSPIPIEINSDKINYTLARVTSDIPWNQGGARNLGVHLSNTAKLILTDLDHIFPEQILKKLCSKSVRSSTNKIYRFRRTMNGKKSNSHPNTFFLTKATYYKSLGVDEEFCGNYGYEDIYFIELQKHLGTRFKKFRKHSISYKNHTQHHLQRNIDINAQLYAQKKIAINQGKPFEAHSRAHLSFDWKIVKSNWI